MTRINLIPVEELTREHLTGEFHEISRVFGLVKKRVNKNHSPSDVGIPSEFTLGRGHVKFFYNKLDWVADRYLSLAAEIRSRSRWSNVDIVLVGTILFDALNHIPHEWWNDYVPSEADVELSRNRILERL